MTFMYRIGFIIIWLAMGLNACEAAAEVVAVVSAKSPVTALTKNQIADIFLGKNNRFPDGSTAVPVDQTEGSAERDEFYLRISGKSSAQIKAYWSRLIFTGRGQPPQEVSNGTEVKKLVIRNPGTIGYIDSKLVDDSVKELGLQ